VGDPGDLGRDIVVVLVAVVAAVFDVRVRRIPSWLTLPGIAAGFVYWARHSTPGQFAGVVAVTALTFVIGFLLYTASILGGGDGKLVR
jgi:Flp pilus assembly protein protease CpaA